MRYILTLAILLLGVTGFAQDKSAYLGKDKTYLDISFGASDTINESETYYVEIENFQDYPQMIDVFVDIDTVSGDCGVEIVLQAKKFSGSTYASISDTVTWAGTADTTFILSTSTAVRYRYYKVLFTADATDQQSIVSDVIVKTWNSGGDLSTSALTLTGNLSVGGTTTLTGATTANGSITLGAGDDLIGSSTSDITFNTNKFMVAGATGNTVIAGTLGVAGASTFTGLITANGGVTLGAGDDLIGSSTSDITINTTAFTVAGATGNTAVGGTLGVTGTSAFTGAVTKNISYSVADGDTVEIDPGTDLEMIDVRVGGTSVFNVDSTGIVSAANGVKLGTSKALTGTTAMTIGDNSQTVAVNSSDWDISATGIITGVGNITSDGDIVTTGKVTAADSLCIGAFKFVIVSDTLCSIFSTDTLRIHPAR